ncbi:SDR family NAD(P)-dependent oxidoreductase [Halorubrum lacusprofundi]|jgi:NAD(P)-dependent dehydrogenase (short-subunit alcohol dehydrogenase family)|uniref:SDR family NAD(P)-dependent oxidoreductase n=1 Tax=Halorubrum lacusprofundi TaxID=2247 RepID=UPI000B5A6A00|nr:glucose 1-dehydrogenase [Halorubrum lacusprofundi]MCG1007571.1 glucose 1-dehydrogenase [Halorubrum lacusprofundi]
MVGHTQYDFSGETAVVTGSTKGIGRGIAAGLADADANVVVNSRTESEVDSTAAELDERGAGHVVGIAADVGSTDDIDALVDRAIGEFGQIDLLVNNAAVWPDEESLVDSDVEQWDHTMAVNVRAQYYAAKRVARHMIDEGVEGCIVNHTSQAGDRRTGPFGLYGISKTSINGLTWRMAQELAEHGIRMNAVSTDVTETAQLRYEAEQEAADDPDRTADEILRARGARRPLGRLGQPEDLADAVLWLASDRADYVVGDIVRVSGGGNLE